MTVSELLASQAQRPASACVFAATCASYNDVSSHNLCSRPVGSPGAGQVHVCWTQDLDLLGITFRGIYCMRERVLMSRCTFFSRFSSTWDGYRATTLEPSANTIVSSGRTGGRAGDSALSGPEQSLDARADVLVTSGLVPHHSLRR